MERMVLKQDVIELIKKDQVLTAKVATAMGLVYTSMPKALVQENQKLTCYSVIQLLKRELKLKETELMEPLVQQAA